MIRNSFSLIGIILIFACVSIVMKRYLAEYSFLMNILIGLIILSILLVWICPIVNEVEFLINVSKIPKEYGLILFKCLGICFITQFSADSCEDCDEKSLSKKIELIGKISILLTALPLFQKVVSMVLSLF